MRAMVIHRHGGPEVLTNHLLTITRLAFEGRLRPVIDRVLSLEQAADGERALENREVVGKVIIRP